MLHIGVMKIVQKSATHRCHEDCTEELHIGMKIVQAKIEYPWYPCRAGRGTPSGYG